MYHKIGPCYSVDVLRCAVKLSEILLVPINVCWSGQCSVDPGYQGRNRVGVLKRRHPG